MDIFHAYQVYDKKNLRKMNFVIYSYNFLPQADAESYCATRFASALSRAGHHVVVVTMDWPLQVSKEHYKALVEEKMEIIRLPFSPRTNSPLKALLWYGHNSQMAVDVPASVKVVKQVLQSIEKPILITRSHPVMSSMVGLRVRKYAYKWIAHFSDPIPWNGYANTIGHKLLHRLEKNIIRDSLLVSDKISLTCKHAFKFYRETYKTAFNEKKAFVTTHIGDYRLDAAQLPDTCSRSNILLHPGSIFADRGGAIISEVMKDLSAEQYDCKFIQVGKVDTPLKQRYDSLENVICFDTDSVDMNIKLVNTAKAIFVPDFESSRTYSPFILSKFVYHLMGNLPLVVYSKRDSSMHDLAKHYPEAGLFWAEMGNIESLKSQIKASMEVDNSTINRTRIRKCFAEETVVATFLKEVESITI